MGGIVNSRRSVMQHDPAEAPTIYAAAGTWDAMLSAETTFSENVHGCFMGGTDG